MEKGWDITSHTFKYRNNLFWEPESGIFQPTTEDQPKLSVLKGNGPGFDPLAFSIHVTRGKSFTSSLKRLVTMQDVVTTKGDRDKSNILKVKLDYKTSPYFASLCAAYVIFHKSGICKDHFRVQPRLHLIVTSIFRYYVYYHMARFLKQPGLLAAFLDRDELTRIQKSMPVSRVWATKRLYGYKGYPIDWYRPTRTRSETYAIWVSKMGTWLEKGATRALTSPSFRALYLSRVASLFWTSPSPVTTRY